MTHLRLSVSHFARLCGASVSPQFQVLFSLWGGFSICFLFFSLFFFLSCTYCSAVLTGFYLVLLFFEGMAWSEMVLSNYLYFVSKETNTKSQMDKFLERQLPVSLQEADDGGIKRGCPSTPTTTHHPHQLSGCKGVRKVSGQRTRWPGSVLLHFIQPLFEYVCMCVFFCVRACVCACMRVCICVTKVCVWLYRKWGRRTCLSPRTSSRLSVSSRLHCIGCVTHTFHIPVDVSGRPARQLIVTHAS